MPVNLPQVQPRPKVLQKFTSVKAGLLQLLTLATVPLKREEWKHGPAAEIATLQSNHENPSQPRIINNQHSHHSLQSLTGVLINLLGYQIDKQLILRIFKVCSLSIKF